MVVISISNPIRIQVLPKSRVRKSGLKPLLKTTKSILRIMGSLKTAKKLVAYKESHLKTRLRMGTATICIIKRKCNRLLMNQLHIRLRILNSKIRQMWDQSNLSIAARRKS